MVDDFFAGAKKKNDIIVTYLKDYAQMETEEVRSSILGFVAQMENVNKSRQTLVYYCSCINILV